MNPTGEMEKKLGVLASWITGVVVFAVVFAISVMGVLAWQAYRVGHNTQSIEQLVQENHASFCAFKLDIEKRHDEAVQYLRDHPNGLVAHGDVVITAAQIQSGIDNQAATLKSLSGLDCH